MLTVCGVEDHWKNGTCRKCTSDQLLAERGHPLLHAMSRGPQVIIMKEFRMFAAKSEIKLNNATRQIGKQKCPWQMYTNKSCQ